MAKTELAVAELIWNMIARKTGNVGKVDFFPQKPAFPFGEGFPGREEAEQPLSLIHILNRWKNTGRPACM